MSEKAERPIIIIKRRKGGGGGHHGGAWKVAYADFVTAMMAFFLVMWLVTAVSKEQRAAIFNYFKNPSMEQGKSVKAAPGMNGPGGASTSPINLGGGLESPKSAMRKATGIAAGLQTQQGSGPPTIEEAKRVADQAEHRQLESLMEELRKAIEKSQALQPFKDQLLLDITPEGLRIQIVDAQNRPMFDLGSAKLKGYTAAILKELAGYLNSVPNRISLTGHTDTTPYVARNGYNNWDLSADRANAARRALETAGMRADKVARVVGLSSAVLFDKENPRNPINRRISIIVMTKQAEESAMKTDSKDAGKFDLGAPTSAVAPHDAAAPAATAPPGPAAVPALSDDPAVTAAMQAVADKPVK